VIHEHLNSNNKHYILGFTNEGIYKHNDSVYSPFNVPTRNNLGEPNPHIAKQKENIYQSTLNKVGNPRTGFIFISNNVETNKGKNTSTNNIIYGDSATYQRKRYVIFSNFIDSFTRDVKFEKIDLTNESDDFSSGYAKSKYASVAFDLSFNAVGSSLEESRKNLGKLQILSRLIAKSTNSVFTTEPSEEKISDSIGKVTYPYKNNETDLKVYVPGMIEKPDASRSLTGNSHAVSFKNALDLTVISCDIKINMEMGFHEKNGKLYPKAFSVSLSMVQKDMSMNTNFSKKTVKGVDKNTLPDETALLFPFNRKYTKIST